MKRKLTEATIKSLNPLDKLGIFNIVLNVKNTLKDFEFVTILK